MKTLSSEFYCSGRACYALVPLHKQLVCRTKPVFKTGLTHHGQWLATSNKVLEDGRDFFPAEISASGVH